MADVDTSTDGRVQQNDKNRTKSREKKVHLGTMGLLLGHEGTNSSDQIQHQQSRQTERSVQLGSRQALQSVDNDQVWRISRIDSADAHQLGHLSRDDVDGRSRHESANGRERDELDKPAEASESEKKNDGASDDGKGRCHNVTGNIGEFIFGFEDNVSCNLRHDGNRLQHTSVSVYDIPGSSFPPQYLNSHRW